MSLKKEKSGTAKFKKLSLNAGNFGFSEILSREELKQMVGGTDTGSNTGSKSGSGDDGYIIVIIDGVEYKIPKNPV